MAARRPLRYSVMPRCSQVGITVCAVGAIVAVIDRRSLSSEAGALPGLAAVIPGSRRDRMRLWRGRFRPEHRRHRRTDRTAPTI